MSELSLGILSSARARPRVSFVVAWKGSTSDLSRRLQVWDRWVDDGIDVVVVCSCNALERQRIERTHPGVRIVIADLDDDLSAMRQSGASAARGDIVVIIDDSVGWTTSWRDHLPTAIAARAPESNTAPWTSFGETAPATDDAAVQ